MPDPLVKPFIGPTFVDRTSGRTFTFHSTDDVVRLTMRLGASDPIELLRIGKQGVVKICSTAPQATDSLLVANERPDSQASVMFISDVVNWIIAAAGSENATVVAGEDVQNYFMLIQQASTVSPGRVPLRITPLGLWQIAAPLGLALNGSDPLKGVRTLLSTLDFPSTAAGQVSLLTRSMPGVRTTDNFIVTPSDWEGGIVNAACYANDVVSLAYRNPDNVAHDPSSHSFRITALQF